MDRRLTSNMGLRNDVFASFENVAVMLHTVSTTYTQFNSTAQRIE